MLNSSFNLLHGFEHGLGGGEEFGVGDVVDDFGAADGGGQDEGAAATALLLVGGGERDELGGGGFGVAAILKGGMGP